MSMTHEQMDAVVAEHFRFEAMDDVDGVLSTLLDGAVHEVIPSPVGAPDDLAEQRGESVDPLRRYYGENFLIDESLWHGRIEDGRPFLCDGRSGEVSFRLLHVFEFRDGKISREQVWCDLAAIQRQLGCVVN